MCKKTSCKKKVSLSVKRGEKLSVKQGGGLVVENRNTKNELVDAAGNTTTETASNVMGLDDDTLDFLMDSTNFDD